MRLKYRTRFIDRVLGGNKNFAFALIGNLSYAGSQYLILVILIKMFSPEDVGKFIYATAFTTPFVMALDMQMRNFYITLKKDGLEFVDFYNFRLYTNILGVVILTSIGAYYQQTYFYVIVVVTLTKIFESQLDLIYAVYQKDSRYDYIAYSRIIRGVTAIVVIVIVALLTNDILYTLFGYFLSWFVLYFFYEKRNVKIRNFLNSSDFSIRIIKRINAKTLLYLGVPVFIAVFIERYYANYPRLLVENQLGIKMLGIFGSLLYFKALGGQFIASMAQTAVPRLSGYFHEKKINNFNRLFLKMMLYGFTIGMILVVTSYFFGETILTMLYTPEYASYTNVLTIILIGVTISFTYAFISTALTSMSRQGTRLPISIISFIFLLIVIRFHSLDSLLDMGYILIYCELFTLLLYVLFYIFYIKKALKN